MAIEPNLATLREARGISLHEISEATKIRTHYLEAIERLEFGRLPGGVYDASYIRQYARAIDYDEGNLLACYEDVVHPQPEPELPVPAGSRLGSALASFLMPLRKLLAR